MKHLYLIFLVSFISVYSFGQKEYFSTYSSTFIGQQLIDGGDLKNSQVCQVKIGEKIIEYTPEDVKDFGFSDGRVFKSREIQLGDSSKKVFLELLHSGKTSLYYYRGKGLKTFFLERDSTLFLELPKQNATQEHFSEQLLKYTDDCSNVTDACKIVSYNKKSLSELVSRYNQCIKKPFPRFKYGFIIGYEYLRMVPLVEEKQDLEYFNYNYDGGFSMGLFLDNPILESDFSFHTEIYFSKHEYSYHQTTATVDLDLLLNITSLRVPMLIRYSLPKQKLRPYINAGPLFSYNFHNENVLYKTLVSDKTIQIIARINQSIISSKEMGYLVGCGLEYDLNFKKSLFVEMRYGKQFGVLEKIQSHNSFIHILSGINF